MAETVDCKVCDTYGKGCCICATFDVDESCPACEHSVCPVCRNDSNICRRCDEELEKENKVRKASGLQELPPIMHFSDEMLQRLADTPSEVPNIPYPEDDDL